MVIRPVGAAILCAEEAWQLFRKQQGIRDPFWDVNMANFRARSETVIINGVECTRVDTSKPDVVHLEPGEEERYHDLHDKFMATYIFTFSGYDTLCRTQYEHMKDWFRPCEDPTGQCSMNCRLYYEDCSQIKIYPSEFADIFEFIKKDLED